MITRTKSFQAGNSCLSPIVSFRAGPPDWITGPLDRIAGPPDWIAGPPDWITVQRAAILLQNAGYAILRFI